MSAIRSQPCSACPYRTDVPPGVWADDEYTKLRLYDAPTGEQPLAAFACHATPEHFCHGWAVVHTSRGHEFDLLALRLVGCPPMPESTVPLFASGNDAADHGQADPDEDAVKVMDRLLAKYPRLQTERGE